MFCRKCGKQIPDDSEFCFKCGAPVVTETSRTETIEREAVNPKKETQKLHAEKVNKRVCPNCGKEIPSPKRTLCPHCGEKLPQLDKLTEIEDEKQSAPQTISLPAITSRKCESCGELVYNNQRSCHNCGAANSEYSSRFDNSESYDVLRSNSSSGKWSKFPQQTQATSLPSITSYKCKSCGKLVCNNQRSCHNCGETNPSYNSLFDNSDIYALLRSDNQEKNNDYSRFKAETAAQEALQKAVSQTAEENRIKDSNTPVVLVNVNIVTKIICIAAIAIALFLEMVIAKNMDVSTYDGVMNHNSVIYVSYFFYGIFFLGIVVRIICAFIIAGMRGELGGIGTFVVVGLIITIIAGAISHSWMACFILFGLIAVAYVGSKIRDWM